MLRSSASSTAAGLASVAIFLLSACAAPPSSSTMAPRDAVTELAPTGKLRAAINFGNPILASRDAAGGAPRGVSVDLAHELAARLGVPVELVTFDAAGKVVEAAKAGVWDIAFVAIDPVRGADMLQTHPYVVIEGNYLVKDESPIHGNDDVDRPGIRVSAARGSAYDLFLTRELRQAQIVRAQTSQAVVDQFVAQGLEVAAGVKQQMQADARRIPGLRLLPERFMVINQAMATPLGRPAGARYLNEFIEAMKASGFVAQALQRHRIEGAAVAPMGPAR